MRPQSCKSKGRRLQQKVAASIVRAFPQLADDDAVSTSMGAPGEDVRLSPRARAVLPLSLECKCVERLNVWAHLEQAQRNAPKGTTPCLVFSRNRAPTYAVVPWDVLLDLFVRAQGAGAIPPRVAELVHELASHVPPLAHVPSRSDAAPGTVAAASSPAAESPVTLSSSGSLVSSPGPVPPP